MILMIVVKQTMKKVPTGTFVFSKASGVNQKQKK